MDADARELLHRIEGWLTVQSPHTQAALRPPATTLRLQQAQQKLGYSLHDHVVELYRWHDGCGSGLVDPLWLAPDSAFISLDDMCEQWAGHNDIAAALFGADSNAERFWSRHWVPIASSFAGSILVVDHRPGPAYGTVFPLEHGNGARRDEGWTSLSELLRELWQTLSTQEPMRGRRLSVNNGELSWAQ